MRRVEQLTGSCVPRRNQVAALASLPRARIVSATLAAPFLGSLLAPLSSEEIVEARRMLPDVVP